MASAPQVAFVNKLLAQKEVPAPLFTAIEEQMAKPSTPAEFSKWGIIDLLKNLPDKPTGIGEGTYMVGSAVYQVVRGKSKTPWGGSAPVPGKLYAKILNPDTGRFEYAAGAFFKIPAGAEKVTLEQAVDFGLRFGRCIYCGHALEAKDSVLLSIGPVCAKRELGLTQKQLVKAQSAHVVSEQLALL